MNNKLEDIQSVSGTFETETPFALHLQFDDCQIDFATNSKQLQQDLEHYFKPFITQEPGSFPHMTVQAIEGKVPDLDIEFVIKQPDPGKTKIKEEYIDFPEGRMVRKLLTGMLFLFGKGQNLAMGPCVQNSNQVINFINNRFIEWKLNQEFLLAHAAGIVWNGKGIAMAGFSGMGKSTLALHLMSQGAKFVSNDRLLFKKNTDEVAMVGVAKLPRINPGTILNNLQLSKVMPSEDKKKFANLSGNDLWDLEQKYDVFIDECFGPGKSVLSSPMDLIVMLNWHRNDNNIKTHFVNFADRRDLLSAFMKSPGLFYEPDATLLQNGLTEENYIAQLKEVRVLEIFGGVNFDQAVTAIANAMNQGSNKNKSVQ